MRIEVISVYEIRDAFKLRISFYDPLNQYKNKISLPSVLKIYIFGLYIKLNTVQLAVHFIKVHFYKIYNSREVYRDNCT